MNRAPSNIPYVIPAYVTTVTEPSNTPYDTPYPVIETSESSNIPYSLPRPFIGLSFAQFTKVLIWTGILVYSVAVAYTVRVLLGNIFASANAAYVPGLETITIGFTNGIIQNGEYLSYLGPPGA